MDCFDGADNDMDGWIDAADPDCAVYDGEVGYSDGSCNDSLDNDMDMLMDAEDPDCATATDEEDGG